MALPYKKAGGGFLKNVAGVIVGGEFIITEGGEGDKAWRRLSAKIQVLQDGADEPVETFLDGGFIYDENITVKGLVIEGVEECPIREDSELAGFVGSMVENGLDESEVGNGLDHSFLVGLRVHFDTIPDEKRNKRSKDGGRVVVKDGKKIVYPFELRRVTKVYGRVDVKKGKATGKASSKPASKPSSKPAKKAEASTDNVDAVLIAIVDAAKDKTIPAKNLQGAVVRYALKNNIGQDDRAAILATITSEEYLADAAERGIVEFDAAKGIIKGVE